MRSTPARRRLGRALVVAALITAAPACGDPAPAGPSGAATPVDLAEQVVVAPALQPGEGLPAPTGDALLTVTGRITAGAAPLRLDAAGLQSLGVRRVSVFDPFIKQPVDYQGLWLADLMTAAEVDPAATSVHLTALDDYEADLDMADIRAGVFLATKTGAGDPIPLADGGPIRIILPGEIPSGATEAKWIWSLSTIDVR